MKNIIDHDYSQCLTDSDKLHKYANNSSSIFCPNVIVQLNRDGELEYIDAIYPAPRPRACPQI